MHHSIYHSIIVSFYFLPLYHSIFCSIILSFCHCIILSLYCFIYHSISFILLLFCSIIVSFSRCIILSFYYCIVLFFCHCIILSIIVSFYFCQCIILSTILSSYHSIFCHCIIASFSISRGSCGLMVESRTCNPKVVSLSLGPAGTVGGGSECTALSPPSIPRLRCP